MYLTHVKLLSYNVQCPKYLIFLGVGGGVVGGGVVGGGGVSSGFVGGFVLGVFGLSGVGDLSDVSAVVIGGVADVLGATVGQKNIVRSRDNFAVAAFLVAEVVVGIVILHMVSEVVGSGGLLKSS